MGLGETQVFQDEKSRLANTTVARIVAAKGSLNDPETKKECCRKLQKLNATLKDRVAAVDAATRSFSVALSFCSFRQHSFLVSGSFNEPFAATIRATVVFARRDFSS